ncbi:MAG TPA: hypothetical protein VHY79_07555 [Rhizomicrobium sp.]|jgi:hypothetical protein|nr:hypothetical protein [Rhizomicrobium sp.]
MVDHQDTKNTKILLPIPVELDVIGRSAVDARLKVHSASLDAGCRIDLLLADTVIIAIKSVDALPPCIKRNCRLTRGFQNAGSVI